MGVTFVDNFDTFWKQKTLYKEEVIHPNHLVSWILSQRYKEEVIHPNHLGSWILSQRYNAVLRQ
jgi:hypothetical protein